MIPRSSRLALSSSVRRSAAYTSAIRLPSAGLASSTLSQSSASTSTARAFASCSARQSGKRSWENPVTDKDPGAADKPPTDPDTAAQLEQDGKRLTEDGDVQVDGAQAEGDSSAISTKSSSLLEDGKEFIKGKILTPLGFNVGSPSPASPSVPTSFTASSSSPSESPPAPPPSDVPRTPTADASEATSSPAPASEQQPILSTSALPPVTGATDSDGQGRVNVDVSSVAAAGPSASAPSPPPPPTPSSPFSPPIPRVFLDKTIILPVNAPLLPPYKKHYNITNKEVIGAIRDLVSHGSSYQYISVFLLRGDNTDVIASVDEVHPTGFYCKIDSFQPADNSNLEGRWTLVVEPQTRVTISSLLPIPEKPVVEATEAEASLPLAHVDADTSQKQASELTESKLKANVYEAEKKGDGEVTSFETGPGVELDDVNFSTEFLLKHSVSVGNLTHVPTATGDLSDPEIRTRWDFVVELIKDLTQHQPGFHERILTFRHTGGNFLDESNLGYNADVLAGLCEPLTKDDIQTIVDGVDLKERLKSLMALLKKELHAIELKQKIAREMNTRMSERQKEMLLHEQMKAIKKELGQDAAGLKDETIAKFKKAAEELNMPEQVKKVFESELNKLVMMETAGSEFTVTRNYLDWIVSIPWGRHTVDSFSIPSSIAILDEDHFGLQEVKDRILEFLAVGKLRGTVEGKILCFVGPPGVGKTSIAKSIARALNRKFYRISVGGLRDVAEIKGHRRTYVGALPGKPIQALKLTGAENPLILIDEIDKVSNSSGGYGGDPLSALLELLDPEQNSSFSDFYLDLPVDLSKVLFVCTANVLSTIPAPLLDRMEVLEISGYVSAEKRAIASRYLSPQAKRTSGLEKVDVQLEDSALDGLIQYYCRESGVRNLKKKIEQIYRKAAFNIVSEVEKGTPAASAIDPPVEVLPPASPTLSPSSATPSDSSPLSDSPAASSTLPSGASTLHTVKPMDLPSNISVRVTGDNLKDYVGPPVFQKDRIYQRAPPPGVSNGLGYTGNGAGALMPIEVSVMPGKGAIQTTGKLGEVINESIKIAVSYLRTNAFALGITANATDIILGGSADQDIHIHMPEGAIGKDGPSAGTAILTALVSLLTKTRIDPDIAMTGEITLGGQVLPVGGLKEKILAAHRSGIKKLIVPAGVRGDIEANVPDSVKEGIAIVYASNVREVLYEVFGHMPVSDKWRDSYPLLDLYGSPTPDQAPDSISARD